MKKWLFMFLFSITGSVAIGVSAELVYTRNGQPESDYVVTHSTVAISSQTVSTDASVSGYRAVYILNIHPTTTVYYTLSTSTQNVNTLGWPIYPYRSATTPPIPEKIEYNGQINYRLAAGSVGSLDVIKKVIQK